MPIDIRIEWPDGDTESGDLSPGNSAFIEGLAVTNLGRMGVTCLTESMYGRVTFYGTRGKHPEEAGTEGAINLKIGGIYVHDFHGKDRAKGRIVLTNYLY